MTTLIQGVYVCFFGTLSHKYFSSFEANRYQDVNQPLKGNGIAKYCGDM